MVISVFQIHFCTNGDVTRFEVHDLSSLEICFINVYIIGEAIEGG